MHGVDVEGKMMGLEEELVRLLGQECPIPVTYAGGSELMGDLDRVKAIGSGIFFFPACFWKVFFRERSSIFAMDVWLDVRFRSIKTRYVYVCRYVYACTHTCAYTCTYHMHIHLHIHGRWRQELTFSDVHRTGVLTPFCKPGSMKFYSLGVSGGSRFQNFC